MSDLDGKHILLGNVFFAPFTYGGATIVAEEVAQALIRRTGCRISAISAMQRTDLAPYTMMKSEKDGIANYLINLPQGRTYAQIYDNPEVTALVGQIIDGIDPDLLHLHCIQDLGAGILDAAAARDLPVVISVHDFWWRCDRQFMIKVNQVYCAQDPIRIDACQGCVENMPAARARFDYLGAQAQKAKAITYPSRFAMDLCETSGLAPGRGVVWPNGVTQPGAGFFDAQKTRREGDPRVTFGFLGGPSQIKGWPIVQRAFTRLGRDDYRLLVVDGGLEESWWTGREFRTLKGDVSLWPRFSQEEMDAFYAEIDVLLFMSQWKETFGLAIREAIVRGIDVIQTDSGGTTEHARADPERMLKIGADASELTEQLNRVLDRPMARGTEPADVTSFDDQAAALEALIVPLLRRDA